MYQGLAFNKMTRPEASWAACYKRAMEIEECMGEGEGLNARETYDLVDRENNTSLCLRHGYRLIQIISIKRNIR